jgi:hypothetical protein
MHKVIRVVRVIIRASEWLKCGSKNKHRSGRVGMMSTTAVCAGRRVSCSSSPLIRLVAEVLATSCGYQMSEEVSKLLERDAEFLAALQWLVLHTLAQQSS